MKRTLFAIGLFFVSLAFAGEPSVVIDRVQQRYPWNNIVDIDYTVAGIDDDPNDYQLQVVVSATVGGEKVEITASNFVGAACCDLSCANGQSRASWNSGLDGVDFISDNVTIKLNLLRAPVSETDADYLIVDLSGGKDAATYPVRYVKVSDGFNLAQFCQPIYKTKKMVMRHIPGGEFTMGNNTTTGGSFNHTVLLTKDCYIGIFPVTQAQYQNVCGTNPSTKKTDAIDDLAAHRPVETIRWSEIEQENGFTKSIVAKARVRGASVVGFGLPTEAQWEKAYRAETTTKYYWNTDSYAEFEKYGWSNKDSSDRTHAVGLRCPNAYGLYDMAGNVWELTYDVYASSYTADPKYVEGGVTVDPVGPSSGNTHVVRGASYANAPSQCSAGERMEPYSGNPYAYIGFRFGRTLP